MDYGAVKILFETRTELMLHLNKKIEEISKECSIDSPSRIENLARDPKTPAHILQELVRTGDTLILEQVAQNPAATKVILEELSKSQSVSVREELFKNPATPKEILKSYIQSKKDITSNVAESASQGYFLGDSEEYLDYLALSKKGLNSDEATSILSIIRSRIPKGLKKTDSDILLGLVLQSKEVSDGQVREIIDDELYDLPIHIMRKMYLDVEISEEEQIELIKTNDMNLLFDLAQNQKTTVRILRELFHLLKKVSDLDIEEIELLVDICENQNITGEFLEEIATFTQDEEIHEIIAKSSKISNSFLINQVNNFKLKPGTRQLYLRNQNVGLETLVQEAINPETWYDLLINPNISFDLIGKLAKSEDPEVCVSVSSYWNLDPEILLFMLTTNYSKFVITSWEQAVYTLLFLGFDVSGYEISQLEKFVPGINPKVLSTFPVITEK